MKKIMYWLSKLTCFFTAYQPDVPESLDLK